MLGLQVRFEFRIWGKYSNSPARVQYRAFEVIETMEEDQGFKFGE